MSTEDPTKWLKLTQDGCGEVNQVAGHLLSLARAFERTGNGGLGQELRYYAERLGEAEQMIREGEGLELSRALHQAQESTAFLFKAAIAGALDSKEPTK